MKQQIEHKRVERDENDAKDRGKESKIRDAQERCANRKDSNGRNCAVKRSCPSSPGGYRTNK